MGRSQVKYRATHGRGRGRGDAARGRGVPSGRGRSSHARNLGSNAYRFEERSDQVDDDTETQTELDYGGRTQFFASEQNYREAVGASTGAHFQSRTMKQWEEKEDTEDDQVAVGVLDLDWIASQLQLVSPDVRYRLDPKYCTDLPFEPQDEDGTEVDEVVAEDMANSAAPSSSLPETPAVSSKPKQGDSELDFLLNLSASASSNTAATPAHTPHVNTASAPTSTPAGTEQLEEWLDDVLDI
ncbi:hypothetical protein PHYBOEH_009902 [Phytophthora boehmeriae]|uniref:Cell death regulator Aven n=1 Tax=Phytophthora boehmeriae TaxID=109152 RepID=A0A8T1X0D5_9STRA|nr:hypothetical protein PHYBOEH_009902 [Phytophthora boehmeriae]